MGWWAATNCATAKSGGGMVRGRHPVQPLMMKGLLSSNKRAAAHGFPPQHCGHAPASALSWGGTGGITHRDATGRLWLPGCSTCDAAPAGRQLSPRSLWNRRRSATASAAEQGQQPVSAALSSWIMRKVGKWTLRSQYFKGVCYSCCFKTRLDTRTPNRHGRLKAAATSGTTKGEAKQPSPPWPQGPTSDQLLLQPPPRGGTYFLHVFIQLLVWIHLTHQVLQFLLG